MFLFVFTEKKNILHFFYTFSFLIFWHLIDHAADVFFLLLTFRIESQNIYDAGGSGFLHPPPTPHLPQKGNFISMVQHLLCLTWLT